MSEKETKMLIPEVRDIELISPYENNAKIHSNEQIKAIANSILKFGFDQPIVVDGMGVIIKGHGRFEAAKRIGLKKVPVIVRTDLTAKEANASRIADNRVAVGDVDTEKLQEEIMSIGNDADLNLAELGFTEKEIKFLTIDLGDFNEDAVETSRDLSSTIKDLEEDTKKITEMNEESVSIAKAIGFNKVPARHMPNIAKWMLAIEERTGKKGYLAFCEFIIDSTR